MPETSVTVATEEHQLVLIGDSDIAYWPQEFHPSLNNTKPAIVSGHPGATLSDVLPHLHRIVSEHGDQNKLVIIACAGENDISGGIFLDNSLRALEIFMNSITQSSEDHRLIFLGPKFEPWQDEDTPSKRQYSKMSRSFERCFLRNSNPNGTFHYIDCLTMFCRRSTSVPGALLGGRANAAAKYFLSDKLHLSKDGYALWKNLLEQTINNVLKWFNPFCSWFRHSSDTRNTERTSQNLEQSLACSQL